MTSPYRLPGEKEPEPKKPRDWSWVSGVLIFLAIVGVPFALGYHGHHEDMEEKAYRFAIERVADISVRSKRVNSCGFQDVDRGFKIVSYDGRGYERTEGFFSTRKEADDFKDNLPRCKGE